MQVCLYVAGNSQDVFAAGLGTDGVRPSRAPTPDTLPGIVTGPTESRDEVIDEKLQRRISVVVVRAQVALVHSNIIAESRERNPRSATER